MCDTANKSGVVQLIRLYHYPTRASTPHVLFVNDQLAVKFIEGIDFDYAAPDATAALITAAS